MVCRIQNARILVENVRGVGCEIIKNLVLAGIASLTVLDSHKVTVGDFGGQFFFGEEAIGENVRFFAIAISLTTYTEGRCRAKGYSIVEPTRQGVGR